MSVKSLIICILFYVLFYFRKYLFCCIRITISSDYISNPVYYRNISNLEKNRSLQTHWRVPQKGPRTSLRQLPCLRPLPRKQRPRSLWKPSLWSWSNGGRPRSRSSDPTPDSMIRANLPSHPVPLISKTSQAAPSVSPIPPGQMARNCSPSPPRTSASWKLQMKGPEDYERDRVGKYAQYPKGNETLLIPEVSKVLEPRILSLVVSDLKTRGVNWAAEG